MEKKKNIKISTEVAIGIIVLFSIVVAIAVYKAGSFSAALNYIPQVRKKSQSVKQDNRVLFAERGDRKIYKVQKDDGKWAVIIDGQEGDAYDDVFNPVFSDDGSQFAYGARNDDWSFVVLNSKASDRKYSNIGQLIFDRDGVLIYKVIDDSGEYLVIGDQEGDRYTSIGEIVILDDGRIAYQAEVDGETVTIIDGQIVDDSQENDTGEDTGETIDDNTEDDYSIIPIAPIIKKSDRPKKDVVIPVTEESHPVCDGAGCNF